MAPVRPGLKDRFRCGAGAQAAYNGGMARGWESKSIESQQADREQPGGGRGPASSELPARRQSRETVELALSRAQKDLAVATHVAHRSMLEAAIGALETQLRTLQ